MLVICMATYAESHQSGDDSPHGADHRKEPSDEGQPGGMGGLIPRWDLYVVRIRSDEGITPQRRIILRSSGDVVVCVGWAEVAVV